MTQSPDSAIPEYLPERLRRNIQTRATMLMGGLALAGTTLGIWMDLRTGILPGTVSASAGASAAIIASAAGERLDGLANGILAAAGGVERSLRRTPEWRGLVGARLRSTALGVVWLCQAPAIVELSNEAASQHLATATPDTISTMGLNAAFSMLAALSTRKYAQQLGPDSSIYDTHNHYSGDSKAAILMGLAAGIGTIPNPTAQVGMWLFSAGASAQILWSNRPWRPIINHKKRLANQEA